MVSLDGTVDWTIAQRRALLAWTGDSISVKPTLNAAMVCHVSPQIGMARLLKADCSRAWRIGVIR